MAGVRERDQCQAWMAWFAAESPSEGRPQGHSGGLIGLSDLGQSALPEC